jgi:radical SAM protein with 4Fe4S-binding SPASM domain
MGQANQLMLSKFNKARRYSNSETACFAPSLSLNFEQNGNVTACCFNRSFILGKIQEQTIKEIWNGPKIKELRAALAQGDFSKGCMQCEKMIEEGNFESVLINHFDGFQSKKITRKILGLPIQFIKSSEKESIPLVFEFELSNTCNLECIMCGGNWSSSIRKNREKLPPIKTPYSEEFVAQITPYLSKLKRANFLGGEPFLIPIYSQIWKKIIQMNKNLEVAITSNGTILNETIKSILLELTNCKITLSVDSLQKTSWEAIRKNGDFDQMKENLSWFLDNKKLVSFSVCPIIQNRYEIPEIIAFCIANRLEIYFNVVYGPLGGEIPGIHGTHLNYDGQHVPISSLQKLSKKELSELIDFYATFSFPGRYGLHFNHLINQLRFWHKNKDENN